MGASYPHDTWHCWLGLLFILPLPVTQVWWIEESSGTMEWSSHLTSTLTYRKDDIYIYIGKKMSRFFGISPKIGWAKLHGTFVKTAHQSIYILCCWKAPAGMQSSSSQILSHGFAPFLCFASWINETSYSTCSFCKVPARSPNYSASVLPLKPNPWRFPQWSQDPSTHLRLAGASGKQLPECCQDWKQRHWKLKHDVSSAKVLGLGDNHPWSIRV